MLKTWLDGEMISHCEDSRIECRVQVPALKCAARAF